jgi:surfeit locus 1 family protein
MDRRRTGRGLILALCATSFVVFAALGHWQIARRAWKHDLIARIDARIHAAPVPAPGPAHWPGVTELDEYRRVSVTGILLDGQSTLVHASTALGYGYWVMTPLRRADGSVVLINQGYVPATWRGRDPPGSIRADGPVSVTGLLRASQHETWFSKNEPATGNWHARDVAAIAGSKGFDEVAPYFIDADADPRAPADAPTGGLTQVSFPDHHLFYALTWFGLAGLSMMGFSIVWSPRWLARTFRSSRRRHADPKN